MADRLKSSDNSPTNEPDQGVEDSDDLEISKSQRKRDATAITELAQTISELPQPDFDRLPLEDDVRHAISELRKIRQFGARKRQLLYAGKILRNSDPAPIEAALDKRQRSLSTETQAFHQLETWRDDLLGEHGEESLTRFIGQYPAADRQRLRQLIRSTRSEQQRQSPPKFYRELFRFLRETVEHNSDQAPD